MRHQLVKVFAVSLLATSALAACGSDVEHAANNSSGSSETSADQTVRACVDSDADNYTFEQLLETGLMSTEPGWKEVADPILTKVPTGGYTRFVEAVCPVVPAADTEMQAWKTTPGKFAMQGLLARIEASGAPGGATVKQFQDRAQAFNNTESEGNDANDAQHLAYLTDYWPAIAEHYCPQNFRK